MSIDNSGPKPGEPQVKISITSDVQEEQTRGVTTISFQDLSGEPTSEEIENSEGINQDVDNPDFGIVKRVNDEAPKTAQEEQTPEGNVIMPGLEEIDGDIQRDHERAEQEWQRRQIEQQIWERVNTATKNENY